MTINEILQWDRSTLIWINSHHNRLLDVILAPISLSGEVAALWIAVFLGMMIFGKKEHRITALTFMLTILVLDRVIFPLFKEHFFRVRPYEAIEGIRQWGIRWGGSSFPSGHAHSVWIAAIILSAQWRKLTIPLVAFALLSCYSRPYFGMHYALDVIIGSVGGIVAAFAALGVKHLLERRARGASPQPCSEEPAGPAEGGSA